MPSPRTVLVAGATGIVGREIVRILRARGYRIRAFSRDPVRAHQFRSMADEVVTGDATATHGLGKIVEGVHAVISCLGAPVSFTWTERRSFHQVDTVANVNLIDAARTAGVSRFVYVSIHIESGYAGTAYVQAHEAVEHALQASGLSHGIVRPTGIFPIFNPFLVMARRGIASIPGDGTGRTNPVHAIDVAETCADVLAMDKDVSLSIGGPDVLTRQALVELAFQAVGKRARILHVPRGLVVAAGGFVRPWHPHTGEVIEFAARVFTSDCVAPCRGHRRLTEYFNQAAAET